jgi:hypothetical protein
MRFSSKPLHVLKHAKTIMLLCLNVKLDTYQVIKQR